MGLENYVSEAEAINRSGVSIKTLQRFVEAGYLAVEVEPDGLRLYSRSQLDEIFGLHSAPISLEPIEEDLDGNPRDTSTTLTSPSESIPVPTEEDSQPNLASYYATPDDSKIRITHTTDVATTITSSPLLEREVTKLKNVIELQEALLDSKDAELKELREERKWLRTRIEKLEDKGERDQILLLSETQTIRRLIVVNEQRQSPVKQFLTWVGLLPAPQAVDNSTQELVRATPVRELRPKTEQSRTTGDEKSAANA